MVILPGGTVPATLTSGSTVVGGVVGGWITRPAVGGGTEVDIYYQRDGEWACVTRSARVHST